VIEDTHVDGFANTSPGVANHLRQRAEELLHQQSEKFQDIPVEEIPHLLHELRVHQIELEMQKEELRHTQDELELARDQYQNLYDFAPVGYLTLSENGLIQQVNLTAAALLGVEKHSLLKQPLSHFVFSEDQDSYSFHHRKLFQTCESLACELRIVAKDGCPSWVQLDGVVGLGSEGQALCRVTVSDISERKWAEMDLKQQHDHLLELVQQQTTELSESKARYHNLFDSVTIGLYRTTPTGEILVANSALIEMLAYASRETLLRSNAKDVF
jgi:PAS domain S-box-containing protein